MDAAGIGVLIGVVGLVMIGVGVYIYDTCVITNNVRPAKPVLSKKKSFKVKNLFSHVDI